jgi:DNA polymerase IIIc chi subunit
MSEAASPVAFHTGVANPVEHALRLTRKALSLGSRVLLIGHEPEIARLDEQLWVAEPGSFLAHARWSEEGAADTRVLKASVWLLPLERSEAAEAGAGPAVPQDRDVLINLGAALPRNAASFPKVIEVVADHPSAKAAGQSRWRAWRALGVQPAHHAFS